MTEPAQTTERQARAMYEVLAERYALPDWDHTSEDLRDIWRRCATEMAEIGKGITYDD
jgi:hypothetical protein